MKKEELDSLLGKNKIEAINFAKERGFTIDFHHRNAIITKRLVTKHIHVCLIDGIVVGWQLDNPYDLGE